MESCVLVGVKPHGRVENNINFKTIRYCKQYTVNWAMLSLTFFSNPLWEIIPLWKGFNRYSPEKTSPVGGSQKLGQTTLYEKRSRKVNKPLINTSNMFRKPKKNKQIKQKTNKKKKKLKRTCLLSSFLSQGGCLAAPPRQDPWGFWRQILGAELMR